MNNEYKEAQLAAFWDAVDAGQSLEAARRISGITKDVFRQWLDGTNLTGETTLRFATETDEFEQSSRALHRFLDELVNGHAIEEARRLSGLSEQDLALMQAEPSKWERTLEMIAIVRAGQEAEANE